MAQDRRTGEDLGRRWSRVQISPPRPIPSVTYRRIAARIAAVGVAAALLGCGAGGHETGPTAVPAPAQAAPAAPSRTSALPAVYDREAVLRAAPGLDPDYLRVLVYSVVTNTAEPGPDRPLQLWPAGVAMRHCVGAGVPQDVVEAAAATVAALTGIPRATSGPCSVEWIIDETITGSGYSEVVAPGHVRLVFHNAKTPAWSGLHELGHAAGLGHSPRRSDLMYYQGGGADGFSGDEATALRLIYGR
jgi:hypothetical protein